MFPSEGVSHGRGAFGVEIKAKVTLREAAAAAL